MASCASCRSAPPRKPGSEPVPAPFWHLYYRFYFRTIVGGKYLCVVVKSRDDDAFVLTAHLNRPHQERSGAMADPERRVTIWYDPEGDYLEVIFDQKPGYFRETPSDQVMEKVDEQGNILGFSVMRVSATRETPLEVAL